MISAIALDLGSTSIKAGLLDEHGGLHSIVAQAAPVMQSDDGRYESDALSYAVTADAVLSACLAQAGGLPPLGLCSQRSSFLLWERASGKPVTPLISWQDTRGAESCAALQAQEPVITGLSGLRLTPYFFASKLRVLLLQHPQWRERLQSGAWLAGTLDTYLIWRWTDGTHHVTDTSMAARTLLMDIHSRQWSPELCALFGIPLRILPRIRPSTGLKLRLNNGLTLQASLADQSAALFASVGESREVALVNLGTGGFVIRYLADERTDTVGYLRTLVYQDQTQQTHVAIEGTLNSIAAALAPYPAGACTPEMLGTSAIFCLAEPSGIGAPYFRKDLGLLFSQTPEQLSRKEIACLLLEAIVFRVARILEDFDHEAALQRVYLSGGLSELDCLQQGIAQCVPCAVFRLQQHDASLQGAAMLAAAMPWLARADAEPILKSPVNTALQQKYLRWKQWLDQRLAA